MTKLPKYKLTNKNICPKCKYTTPKGVKKSLLIHSKLTNKLFCKNCFKYSEHFEMVKLKRKLGWCYWYGPDISKHKIGKNII